MKMFYLQDSRDYVGNDVLWWAKDGNSYTTDLSKAQAYSQEAAQSQHNLRNSDIPWPKDYIDARSRPAVDMQYIKRSEALEGSGITLTVVKYRPSIRDPLKCIGCGRFLSDAQFWTGNCPSCGADNRP